MMNQLGCRFALRAFGSLLSLWVLGPSAATQETEPKSVFTTAPDQLFVGSTPNIGGVGTQAYGRYSDGDDIRANQVTTNLQNETSISINPNDPDNIVCVANDVSSGTFQVGYYTTYDGGITWTTGLVPIKDGFLGSADPAVAFRSDGICFLVCIHYNGPGGNSLDAYRSSNGGSSWSFGVEIDRSPSTDKPQIAVDRLEGENQIAVAWNRFPDEVWAATSSNGIIWNHAQKINDGRRAVIGPDLSYGTNHALFVMWADRQGSMIRIDASLDGGATWGADRLVTDYVKVPSPLPGSSFRVNDIFAMDVDTTEGPHHGTIYVTYHAWTDGNANVYCARSQDQGGSWQFSLVNSSDKTNADQVMPGISVDSIGQVNITYYDRRLDPNNALLWTWISRSSDGGAEFRDYRVSDVGWDHEQTEDPTFIGDYIDCEGTANTLVPCWCDGRSGSQDIYIDRMQLNLLTDVSEVSVQSGGTVQFDIHCGPNHGGLEYLLLGSLSGTYPGFRLGAISVPLNFDSFTFNTITNANSDVLPGSRGWLTTHGDGQARLIVPNLMDPTLVGTELDFAILVEPLAPQFATHPTRITLVD